MNYYSLILALLSLGGLIVTLWGFAGWRQKRRRRQWPQTTGTISVAEAGDDLLPDIRYRYEVAGQTYENGLQLPSATEPSEELSRSLLGRYPVGRTVEVRYDPEAPANASIGEQDGAADWLIITIGLAAFLFGAYALMG